MEFTADQVWGAAVAANRVNGGYLKEGKFDEQGELALVANKHIVKKWLREGDFSQITEEDIAEGLAVRNHIKTYLLRSIAGQITDFEKQALKLAEKEQFTGRDLFEFAVISSLPNSVRIDKNRQAIQREIYESEPLEGEVGSTIIGDIEVLNSRWSLQYGKFRITARMNESIVDFWHDKTFTEGEVIHIKARIKCRRDNNTTQLNYVKRA